MSRRDALREAQDRLRIADVYLRELSLELEEDFQPKWPQTNLRVQFGHGLAGWRIVGVGGDADPSVIVQYVIDVGVRVNAGGEQEDQELTQVIEARAKFVAEYVFAEPASQEDAEAFLDSEPGQEFGRVNAVFHVWPYWRELVHDLGARIRLPTPITLPMFRVTQGSLEKAKD